MTEIIVRGERLNRQQAAERLRERKHPLGKSMCEIILEVFWAAFPWQTCGNEGCAQKERCLLGCLPAKKKMELLSAAAGIDLAITKKPVRTRGLRQHFNEHRREYENGVCFVCGKPFHHRHHIIQLQNNGRNRGANIVLLCKPCHRRVHQNA